MKGLLKFITCGSVDDGKSTLIGHILYPVFQEAFLYSFSVILMHDYRLFSSHEQMFISLILAHL